MSRYLSKARDAVRAYQAAIEAHVEPPLTYLSRIASTRVDAVAALSAAMRLDRAAMGGALAALADEASIRIVGGGIDSRQLDALACMLARAEVRVELSDLTTCADAAA